MGSPAHAVLNCEMLEVFSRIKAGRNRRHPSQKHFAFNPESIGRQFSEQVPYTQTRENVMLVICRRIGEEIMIGTNVRLVVSAVAGNRVKLSIDAPESVKIVRPDAKQFEQHDPCPLPGHQPHSS